jgi:hypothetical protein
METGTFQQDRVVEYINRHFVPLKYESGRDAEQFQRFAVRATPTFIVLDSGGNELFRETGYYEADDFVKLIEGRMK